MKVSRKWLKELVNLKVSEDELVRLLPLRTIGIKEVTSQYIELDMKGYNRADLLSLRGVAYEVEAITDSGVKFKEEDEYIWDGKKLPKIDIKVQDSNLAPLYCLAKIAGLKVGPSSKDWIKKLSDSGYRSINNIADVTNLVMIEYGQPLHAFDANEVKDEKIIVRTAKKGEELTTLDNKKRVLEESDLLITDQEKPLGIAGVMGGKNSEISDSTTTILLEAAIFDPKNLRKTATRLGLQSEASKRFYHGLTQKRLFQALSAAIKMYQDLGGKLTGLSIVGEYPEKQKQIDLSQKKVNSLIGVNIQGKDVESYLKKLHFDVTPDSTAQASLNDNSSWSVRPPYFRLDVEIEEDVIEEVARLYGYEKIPAKALAGEIPRAVDQSLFNLIHNIKNELVKIGLTEVQTYPYFSTKVLGALGFYKKDNLKHLVKVANPISAETEYLRQNLWPNLLEVVDRNLRQGFQDIAVFEVGKVYKEEKEPYEKYLVSVVLMNNTEYPIKELHSLLQIFSEQLGVKIHFGNQILEDRELFHPNRNYSLSVYGDKLNGKHIGMLVEIHPSVVNKFGIDKRVAMLELEITKLL